MSHQDFILDRYTTMGDLTASMRRILARGNSWIVAVLTAVAGYLFFIGSPGAVAFCLIAIGTVLVLKMWAQNGIGLPLLPLLAFQHLVTFGLPIAVSHPDVFRYPAGMVTRSGIEVVVLLGALMIGWRLAMMLLRPASPLAYTLQGIDREGVKGLKTLGFSLIGISTTFLVLQSANLASTVLGLLPSGAYSIFWAALSATSACGFFIGSMIVESGQTTPWVRAAFWLLLFVNCAISAGGFLLSGAGTTVAAVSIGLLWGRGRIPWRFIVVTLLVLSFLNLGKFTMRAKFWNPNDDDAPPPSLGLANLPNTYAMWAEASYASLTGSEFTEPGAAPVTKGHESQNLFDRLNNLQNLLYVMDAEQAGVPSLHGATYLVIPPLLVPRIMWPDKPRSHAGQVLLNVHFGRQDLSSTFQTYIAWGLLAEAYGNFGPIVGAILLGLVLGALCGWAENLTVRKPVLSTEGFVSFVIFMGIANAYEMVASVLITSVFQSVVPVILACAPFARRGVTHRPAEASV